MQYLNRGIVSVNTKPNTYNYEKVNRCNFTRIYSGFRF